MATSGLYRQVAPDRIEIREGGGCLSAFGVPFLLAGIFLALIGARIVPLSNARDVPVWAWPLIVLMGLVFMGVGGVLVFGRQWIVLDIGRGKVLKQRGLLFPMQTEEYQLEDYEAVVIRHDAGDSDSAETYPVLLRVKGGRADLRLSSSQRYGDSHAGAAAVAKLLRVPLVDATTEHQVVIGADRVDESFQERVRAGDARREDAARPLRMRCQVRESSRAVEIVLPGPGFSWARLVGPAVSIGILTYVGPGLFQFFQRTRTPEAVQIAFFGFAVLLFVIPSLLGLLRAVLLAIRGRTLVTASPEGIRIEEQGAWRVKTTRIPAPEILGLDYGTTEATIHAAQHVVEDRVGQEGPQATQSLGRQGAALKWVSVLRRLVASRGIIVKTRGGLVTVGAGLPDDEVRYLHALVTRAVGGEEGHRW
jgi:hypothetical protein